MKKYYFLTTLVLLIIPQISHASWWNPATWGQTASVSENQKCPEQQVREIIKEVSVEVIKEVPVEIVKEVPVEKIVTKTVSNPALQDKINSLTIQIENLKKQLALAQDKPVSILTTPAVSDEVRAIKVKLAELAQLDYKIDSIDKLDLLKSIRKITDLNGKLLFDGNNNINLLGLGVGAGGTIATLPSREVMKLIIENYRQELKVLLEMTE